MYFAFQFNFTSLILCVLFFLYFQYVKYARVLLIIYQFIYARKA